MKRFFLLLITLFLIGCKVPVKQQVDAAQNALNKQERKIDLTISDIEKVDAAKKQQTATLTAGIQHSLLQITNPPIQVDTAKVLNERVVSIIGSPHLDEIKRIKATVDLLNSHVAEERKRGEELLSQRDKIISELQKQNVDLKQKYDDQLWQLADKAKEVAKESDAKQATINEMGGMFGLNAVIWGLKRFFFSCLTGILIFLVIFVVLRILSMTNPIAASIFSIFNMIGSAIISTVKAATPNAFTMSKLVDEHEHVRYKETLDMIVDTIQEFRVKEKEVPDKQYKLSEILNTLDRIMDQKHKDVIDELLINQKWKR
jgi:hypothetical protein